ncbi:MAG: hypothetical protein ACXWWR_06455 [Candidatus Limnocylindrales bacterium]
MSHRHLRRGLALAASLGLLVILSAAPGVPAVVAAADDGIDVRTASTYTLLPKDRLVRVVVDVTARNTSPPTTSGNIITRYFFSEIHLALQPEAVRVRATQDGQRLATTTDTRKGYVQVAVTFRAKLYFGQTDRVRVTYDLPGGKPRSKSDIRVGAAFATFYVWVNGDRASIRIVLPDTFEPSLTGEPLAETHEGSKLVYSAQGISDTAHWYAAINADRPSGLRSEALTIPTGEAVTVRAWPEDDEWLDRVADRLRRGLPELHRLIGLPWPVTGELVVTEVHTPLLEGYSGLYHPDTEGIEISEDLDDLTIVHEASHAWFNSALFVGRWINEGLANTYATKALHGMRIDSPPPFQYPRTDPAAFALNDWPPLGRISDAKTEAREDYGYQTSFRVVDSIVSLVGDDGMGKVFAAAAAREIAYVGAPPIEHRPAVADWRALLDYLQERADSSNAEAQFRQYVVDPADLRVLDTRATARQAYARLYDDGQGWFPPFAVRSPMASWDFATATSRIVTGESILDLRAKIAATGAPVGLSPPDALKAAYEDAAATDLGGVLAAARADLDAVTAISVAAGRVDAPRDPLTTMGLVGVEPEAELDAAVDAYRANRIDEARAHTSQIVAWLDAAPEFGTRAVGGIVGAGLVVVALGLAIVVLRRRSRRAEARALAEGPAPGALWGPGPAPTATLPSQSPPEHPGADGGVEPTVSERSPAPPDETAD